MRYDNDTNDSKRNDDNVKPYSSHPLDLKPPTDFI